MGTFADGLSRAFRSPAPFISWAAITAVLALSGPFGTYLHCTLLTRTVCFATLSGIAILWGVTLRVLMQTLWPRFTLWQAVLVAVAISAIVLPVPLTVLAPVLTHMPPEDLPGYPEAALLVAVFGLGAGLVRWTVAREIGLRTVTAARVDEPKLMARLDPEMRGPMVRLSGRDHYVDVVTEMGTTSVLMRLSDAIAELDGVDGLQVHRSHWVAARAVKSFEIRGDRRFLVLTDGTPVPISRNAVAEAERRGLIQRGMGTGRATGPVRTAMAPGTRSAVKDGSELANPPV